MRKKKDEKTKQTDIKDRRKNEIDAHVKRLDINKERKKID